MNLPPNLANVPAGSYQTSCGGCQVLEARGPGKLVCTHCTRSCGALQPSEIRLSKCAGADIGNLAGVLTCESGNRKRKRDTELADDGMPIPEEKPLPPGRYKERCRGCYFKYGFLTCAGCLRDSKQFGQSTSMQVRQATGRCISFGTSDGRLKCDKLEPIKEQQRQRIQKPAPFKQEVRSNSALPDGNYESSCYSCSAVNFNLTCLNCFRTDRSSGTNGTISSSILFADCEFVGNSDGQLTCERRHTQSTKQAKEQQVKQQKRQQAKQQRQLRKQRQEKEQKKQRQLRKEEQRQQHDEL